MQNKTTRSKGFKQFFTKGLDILEMIRVGASDAPDAWERSITKFEAQDAANPTPDGAIVFTGSSSITFWETLEQDMAPLPVINRGFGGSRIHQVTHFVNRMIVPYRPRAVVLFAGTNDLAGPHPRTALQIFQSYRAFVLAVQSALPEVLIYYVSITPAPSRWKLWPIASQINDLIRVHCETDPRLRFIDISGRFLGQNGTPRPEFFRFDRLHPNALGYTQWTAGIKPVLLSDLLEGSLENGRAQRL